MVAYLRTRADVNPDKLGWFGSSSTGIPGLAVATQGPRLAAVVDPILHASNLWPTATLLVNGGDDKVVDIRSARAFVEAARPAFTNDPARLRLVNYEGFGHNLPLDVVRDYAERWFRLYLHPVDPPPGPPVPIRTLAEAARQTQINAASHASVVGARVGDEVTRLTSENENRDSSRRHLQDQEPVAIGCGGTIGFVGPLAELFGGAPALLLGIEDPKSNAHAPNESLHEGDWFKLMASLAHLFENLGNLPGEKVK